MDTERNYTAADKAELIRQTRSALREAVRELDCAWQAGDEATRKAGAHSNESPLFMSFVEAPKAKVEAARAAWEAAKALPTAEA